VAARLAGLGEAERRVIQVAAVLGRQFDWRLLLAAAGADGPRVVGRALEQAVGSGLVDFHGGAYQFRHALTREAILDDLLPHVRAELSQVALAAVEAGHPGPPGASRDLAADLAGAEALRRPASALLAEALALAGRVDECISVSAAALGMSATAAPAARAQIHLAVAHAAVEATRWPVAADQLASAERLLAEDPDPALTQRWRVLAAETALAERDVGAAGGSPSWSWSPPRPAPR
jgi:hypothetical protein